MRRLTKGLLILAALLIAAPTYAQQQQPSGRVGRVSIVEGALAFYGAGDSDWSSAKVNFPVAENGWFATDPNSRAELRIGSASVSLDTNTQAGFTALNERRMQIALAQGRVDLHLRRLRKGETAEVDIERGGVRLLQSGIYEVESGGPDQPSRVVVFEGAARFVGSGIDTTIKAGDALVLNGTDPLASAVEPAAPDDFTRWCRSHDYQEDRLAAPYHVSPAMTGFEELDSYGQWAAVPEYGDVWYPASVADDWAPYREGHWALVEPWGWTWVDDEPWGFAPFHYGRWARIDDRWGWVPGAFVEEPVYAPALVAFVEPPADFAAGDAGPAVGWFPLAPGELYWPSYTRDRSYIRNVNITNVNVGVINRITQVASTQPAGAPPPQVLNQRFANRSAATMVPAAVLASAATVAPAAVRLPPQALQQTRVAVRPPPVIAPPSTVARPTGIAGAPPPRGLAGAAPPSRGPAAAPNPATAAIPATGRPPARPNFSHLAPAPQLARPGAQPAQATTTAPAQAGTPEQRPAEATIPPPAPGTHAGAPQPPGQAAAPPTPGRPPGPPDFSHLAPSRVRPGQPGQAAAPATAAPQTQPGTLPQAPETRTATPGPAHPPVPPPGVAQTEPAQRPGHTPADTAPAAPPAAHAGAPAPAAPPAAQQQAQQRAAAQAASQQQAQQRAAQAAAQQQAQQRAAAQAAAQQQAQQRAAAQAAAQQQAAAQAAAQQQAQQRAAQAAAQQQAQQRAAQAAAQQQQAQQRAAQAAAQQQAQQKAAQQHGSSQPHCGHPNEPVCPK